MLIVKCDLCKDAVGEDMRVLELKAGKASSQTPQEQLAAHVCDACWKTLGAGEFIHRLRSAGATDVVRAAVERAQAQRPQVVGPDAPAPVDARLLHRIQGR